MPAYLEWLDPQRSLVENIRKVFLSPDSMFVADPTFLLYDEVREPHVYLAILKAEGLGAHTLNDISTATLIDKAHLSSYLSRLQELYLVERRLLATIPMSARCQSRMGRYHLCDAYFRFYGNFRLKTTQSSVAQMKGGCAEGAHLRRFWKICAKIVIIIC